MAQGAVVGGPGHRVTELRLGHPGTPPTRASACRAWRTRHSTPVGDRPQCAATSATVGCRAGDAVAPCPRSRRPPGWVEGTLIAAPVRRTSAKGSTVVTAQVRCHADDGESIFCSVIAFQAAVAEALAALAAGDTVAVTGAAAPSQWEKNGEHRVGLKVTATRVLSVYEAGIRRRAASVDREPRDGRPPVPDATAEQSRPQARPATPAAPRRLTEWDNDEPV